MKKRAFLIGGSQKAQALAASLGRDGYRVTIINKDLDTCRVLTELTDATVIHGDGARPYVLDDAHVHDAEIAIALTRSDEDNLVILQLCKKMFRVKRTVALVNDPQLIQFFRQMGVDSVLAPVLTITSLLEAQALTGEHPVDLAAHRA